MLHKKPRNLLPTLGVINRTLLVTAAFVLAGAPLAEVPLPDLRTQLHELALTHNFVVRDLDRVDDTSPGKLIDGNLREQLNHLLEDYSHIILSDPRGSITEIMILESTGTIAPAARPPGVPKPYVRGATSRQEDPASEEKDSAPIEYRIATRRNGTVHTVNAVLLGRRGRGKSLPLVLDLKGTAVVLPASMLGALGFHEDEVEDGWIHTRYGNLAGKLSTLTGARVSRVAGRDVAVAFVEDEVLGDRMLFGVKALTDFSAALDEVNDEIVFVRK